MDDGSSSSKMSMEMLASLWQMGVQDVALTPHFYARSDEPDRFLYNRDKTAEHLAGRISEQIPSGDDTVQIPRLYLGAEVAFFNAMSNVEAMRKLCLSGTDLLLVEMPFERWTRAMIEEIYELAHKQSVTPMLAHIDRYYSYFKEEILDEMVSKGIKIQINAEGFTSLFTRRRSLDLLIQGKIHFIGSDCHNMTSRAPNIDAAIFQIEKKLGEEGLSRIYDNSRELAECAVPIYPVSCVSE
jgi:protein-tyrosine phosphatase